MAGLENITNTIISEAKASSDEILAKYKAEADAIIQTAEAENEKVLAKAKEKASEDQKKAIVRANSSAQLKKRQAILQAKQAVITELLEKAYDAILSMDDQSYFDMLSAMMKKHMEPSKDGEIYFSEKDLSRMPASFKAAIDEIATSKGSKITVMDEAKSIDGGFVLVYGGIEENCSIKAILDNDREAIADKVNALLFA